jgi:hypothetical protein
VNQTGKSQITVEYTFFNMLEEVKNVTFTWTKTCGSGQRQGFFVDAVLGDDDSDSFPVVTVRPLFHYCFII